MNENDPPSNEKEKQTISDNINQNSDKTNVIDGEDYYYYYSDEEEDDYFDEKEDNNENNKGNLKESKESMNNTSQDQKSNTKSPNLEISSPDKNFTIQQDEYSFSAKSASPQFTLASKKESVSEPVILCTKEKNDSKTTKKEDNESNNNECYRSYPLPDFKPKNIGKGFSSSSSDDNEYDAISSSKSDIESKNAYSSNTVNGNDDNYYSDDSEDGNGSPQKTKAESKVKSNPDKKKSDVNEDSISSKPKKKEKVKTRVGRRKSYGSHHRNKQHKKKHHRKCQSKNGNEENSSAESSGSIYSNDSFNEDEDSKSDSNRNSSLISITDNEEENEIENDDFTPEIQKMIDDYKSQCSQLTENNEKLLQKVEQLESEKEKLKLDKEQMQKVIDELKEENQIIQKRYELELEKEKEKEKEDNKKKSSETQINETHSLYPAINKFKDIKTKKICLLGRGSSSKVIEVEDIKTGKHYAKKILFKEFLNFQGIKHFIAEFELLQYLNHPCTATVYGFEMGTDDQHPCAIYFDVLQVSLMSAISASDTLAQTLSSSLSTSSSIPSMSSNSLPKDSSRFYSTGHRLFTNSLRARCLVEICCGMEYVHACGIIHRDLKAENILFNETLNAKICDFGIAQLQSAENLTKNIGSLFYMSPEMLSEKEYDKRTDVYSFGILAYFVLTGELPKIPLNKKVLGCLPEIPPYVTELGKEIILTCCAFHPKDRPSFSDLLNLMESNNFQLINNIDNDFVKKRYEELKAFKTSHPAQVIK